MDQMDEVLREKKQCEKQKPLNTGSLEEKETWNGRQLR